MKETIKILTTIFNIEIGGERGQTSICTILPSGALFFPPPVPFRACSLTYMLMVAVPIQSEGLDLDFEILDNAFSADTKRKGLDFDFETAL